MAVFFYHTLARLEVSKKTKFWVHVFGSFWRQRRSKYRSREAAKTVVKIYTQIQTLLGPFWGPFGSGHAVLSHLRLSPKCGPLKIVILIPSWHPKSIKVQIRYMLKMIGTSSAQKTMLFFLSSLCYFRSSVLALLVSMSKFKHIYASEPQLSTRFPFPCQDRFLRLFKRGSENEVEKKC